MNTALRERTCRGSQVIEVLGTQKISINVCVTDSDFHISTRRKCNRKVLALDKMCG